MCRDFTSMNMGSISINKLIHHDLFDHLQYSQTIYSWKNAGMTWTCNFTTVEQKQRMLVT